MRAMVQQLKASACVAVGAAAILIGVWLLALEKPPQIVGGIISVIVGLVFLMDASNRLQIDVPKARLREKWEELGDPTGVSLPSVREVLGRERDFRRVGNGCELTWRAGKTSVTLGFDGNGICTGTVATAGLAAR